MGQIACEEWFRSIHIRTEIQLYEDEFIVMPNHVHGIVWIRDNYRKYHIEKGELEARPNIIAAKQVNSTRKYSTPYRKPRSLSTFISGYKAKVTSRSIRELHITKVWQRNYYEHIIRKEDELIKIYDYIEANPLKWAEDIFHTQ